MTIAVPLVNLWNFTGAVELESPFSGGSFNGAAAGFQKLATDPVGLASIVFDGVVPGSEIRVYLPDGPDGSAGTEVAGIDSCAAGQMLSWPVYSAGSPNNTVWIHILKRGLRWMKFHYISMVGEQSIPIFQNVDLGYNNPPGP